MAKGEMLRALVKQRLTAAAEEIFGLFERTIAEYEEELCFSREVNERQQKLLDGFLNANDRAQTEESPADVQPPSMVHQEVNTERQDCSPNLDQENPDLILVKVEQEELCISRDREYKSLRELLEADTTTTLVRLKTVDGVKPESSRAQHRQTDQNGVEMDGVDWAASEPAVSLDPDSYLQPLSDDQTDDSSVVCDADWKKAPDSDNKDSDSDWTKDVESASDTDNSDEDWEQSRENKSHLNKKTKPPGRSSGGHMKAEAKLGQVAHRESLDGNSSVAKHEDGGPEDKPFGCSLCDTRFTGASTLLRHMTSHTSSLSDNKLPNPVSDVKKTNDDVAVGNTRGKEKEFNCPVCGKAFRWKSYLKRHMEAHTGHKSSRCSICGTRFSDHSSLIFHMRRHNGEEPFSCSVCHKSFKRKSYVRGHMKTHSRDLRSSVGDSVNTA